MTKKRLSDHDIDSMLLPEQSVEFILSARHIVSDLRRNQHSIYKSASGIETAAQLLEKSQASGIAVQYHEIVADMVNLAWKQPDMREDICDNLAPYRPDRESDLVYRLIDLSADNSRAILDIFINRRFYEVQNALNQSFRELGIAC